MSIFPGLQSLQCYLHPTDGTGILPVLAHPSLRTLSLNLILLTTVNACALPLDLSIFPALSDLNITWSARAPGEQELASLIDATLGAPGLRRLAFKRPWSSETRPFTLDHLRRVVRGLPKLEWVSVYRLHEGSGEGGDEKRIPRVRRILVGDGLVEESLQKACQVSGPVVIELNV